MPKLYVLSGPDIGKSLDVVDGATLGRAAECAVHLRDASVSRHHARIVREGGAWRIVDTQSRNGISVLGSRVESAPLEDGVEFQVGEVLLRFRADAAAEPGMDEIALEEEPAVAAPEPRPAAPPAAPLERTVLAARRAAEPETRGRGILQYKRIADRPGFFASDLAQQPLWIRLGAGLIALLAFAAIFLFAFKGTSILKARSAEASAPASEESSR
jgi:predicted component of type VI protein secretion system